MKQYLTLLLKGMAMGAADIIPGVSGGTIAFITGIYEKLIFSLKAISDTQNLKLLIKLKIKPFWNNIYGNFLLAVFGGILISVFSLAKLITFLLENYPLPVWAFFFGLILASAAFIIKQTDKPNISRIIIFLVGVIIAFYLTSLPPLKLGNGLLTTFLSGAIAICAMILPGISGSFILVVLGQYQRILTAVNELDIVTLLVFMLGAVLGLILFSKFLAWLLKRFHSHTIYLLAGFMIGALNKVWPWKVTLSHFIDRHGHIHPLLQQNLLPNDYLAQTGQNPKVIMVLASFITGILLIYIFEKVTKKYSKEV